MTTRHNLFASVDRRMPPLGGAASRGARLGTCSPGALALAWPIPLRPPHRAHLLRAPRHLLPRPAWSPCLLLLGPPSLAAAAPVRGAAEAPPLVSRPGCVALPTHAIGSSTRRCPTAARSSPGCGTASPPHAQRRSSPDSAAPAAAAETQGTPPSMPLLCETPHPADGSIFSGTT